MLNLNNNNNHNTLVKTAHQFLVKNQQAGKRHLLQHDKSVYLYADTVPPNLCKKYSLHTCDFLVLKITLTVK